MKGLCDGCYECNTDKRSTIVFQPHRHCDDMDIKKLRVGSIVDCYCGERVTLKIFRNSRVAPPIRYWDDCDSEAV